MGPDSTAEDSTAEGSAAELYPPTTEFVSKCRLYDGTLENSYSTAELKNNDSYGGANL